MSGNAAARSRAGTSLADVACLEVERVLAVLDTSLDGLSSGDVVIRRTAFGPNAVREHRASIGRVLGRQLNSPLLLLLAITAAVSFFLADQTDATIIGIILVTSVGLGFANEYRAERTAAALHDRVEHTVLVTRDGLPTRADVVDLVPGDLVRLHVGAVVPADVRLLEANGLECNESMITGESIPVPKSTGPLPERRPVTDLANCALMGTIVTAGSGVGAVVATGADAEFGRIARGLGDRQPETDFQQGLRRFSLLLMRVAAVLAASILATSLLLQRSLIDSLLFALAIAVGITPQLLPTVVSASLAAGSRALARVKVLVKRLVCIEDLGDLDVLVTDKTGTLTNGHITFSAALDARGAHSDAVLGLALSAADIEFGANGQTIGGTDLDQALSEAPRASEVSHSGARRLAELPFDHQRRINSVLLEVDGQATIITRGAPEAVIARCADPCPADVEDLLANLFRGGERVIAIATRPVPGLATITHQDEAELTLAGFVTFSDLPKPNAAASLRRLLDLGVDVKVATGDNPTVAETVCRGLGMPTGATLTGIQIEAMDDTTLTEAAHTATIFARVSPEQKARLVRLLRNRGHAVGFLGDGVNDALALHAADVGISVDTAVDVAKDAADVILLDKDLGVLADGIQGGRRIFANTIKYVLMGTSSNFGNMFSAAGASALLSFLPMLPDQILLNNLLYDASQLAIPSDTVDDDQLRRPSHWDIGFIRRFMLFFGPISSLFDFLTFGIMLGLLHAGPDLFRTGWFVESLATQTLIVFAIRTRHIPFWRSRPSVPLLVSVLSVVAVGIGLPLTPLAPRLGFMPLPLEYYIALAAMVALYLGLIEVGKRWFYSDTPKVSQPLQRNRAHRVHRRASRFSVNSR